MLENIKTLTRYDWTGVARVLGEMWTVTKDGRQITCRLVSHPLGWELRLELSPNQTLLESKTCKVELDVFDTADAWRARAISKGWGELSA
jgi:hypothetical protein